MKRRSLIVILLISIAVTAFAQTWPASLAGRWTFDNPGNLVQATVGNNLVLSGSHIAVNGPAMGDGAVAVGVGSYYTCTHGIPANGGGSLVNEYSLLFDVMIDNPNVYHCFFQTNQSNSNDGDAFINTNSQLGITATGYSGFSLRNRTWYRVVITVDNGSSFRYYVNGHQIMEGNAQLVDATYGLDPTLLFFADENGEDNLIYCAQVAIFSSSLTSAEVSGLGRLQDSDIKPYLQTPTPTSMIVSWNSFYSGSSSTRVEYGITPALGSTTSGTSEAVSSVRWHTVNLTGLTSDTRYYYRCISDSDTSDTYIFRTPAVQGTPGRHIRFVKVGDSQANAADQSRLIGDTIAYVLKQLYGNDWMDSVSFVMHTGDIVTSGTTIGMYMNEFFNSYASLSRHIPVMISTGNHENESAYFYQFVKYEDLSGNNEKYYTFNLGSAQFISLNTNGLYNFSTQTNWLQAQLNTSAMDPSTDFVFVYNHQPGHSEMWPDGNTSYVENDIMAVLKAYPKMAMVTWGHSHNYERGTALSTHASNWDFRTVLCGGAGGALDRWGMYSNQTNYGDIQKSADHYSFMIVDVDVDAETVNATTYSLGHTDLPRNLEVVDRWHRYPQQPAPNKPDAIVPYATATVQPILTASAFSGVDTLMSSQFQLVSISGSFSAPLVNVLRDTEDFYGDSGSPLFNALNLNAGIDLSQYQVPAGVLSIGQTYMWRMRYRDCNVRWSDWSDTLQFQVTTTGLKELPSASTFSAYPNPSEGSFTLVLPENSGRIVMHLTDLYGRIVFSGTFNTSGVAGELLPLQAIDKQGNMLPAGIYRCTLETGEGVAGISLIIF